VNEHGMEYPRKPAEPVSAQSPADRADHPLPDGRPLRRRADGVWAGQKEALELALSGASLDAVLGVLARTAEVQCSPGTLASVLWLDDDGEHLRLGASGSLPEGFQRALDGLESGPAAGPCFDAMNTLAASGTDDFEREGTPWPSFRTLAMAHGLRACWAVPVLSSERRPLGVLALYRRDSAQPCADDQAVAHEIVHTLAVVLDHERRTRRRHHEDRGNDDFLTTLAHELRNPLAPLRNAIELLGRAGADTALMERARSIMSRQVTQLARLIDELADLARSAPPPLAMDAAVPALERQLPLPVLDGDAGAAPAAARRVLVADDNHLVRESFVELLESEGYEVRTAADGEQAVEIAEQWRPQVVLLDIHMPRLSGLETARRLRAVHAPQAMTLLMMSGMTLNDAWIRHAKAAGFDDCLDKTADPQAWLARLRQAANAHVH
jgi:CheY-like chemotaxis protein